MNLTGQILLLATFVLTFLTALAALVAGRTGSTRAYLAARSGVTATFCFFTAAAFVLFYQLYTKDYSNKYVSAMVENGMSWSYRLAAFWGSETGALLFWTWLLSIFSVFVVRDNRGEKNRILMPDVIMVLMLGIWFFNLLLVFKADPFASFVTKPAPLDGRGVNPLLRHPMMVMHPPSLLLGFMGFTVPFAFGVSALINKRLGADWIAASRKYSLISWAFLSVGLVLGGMWAYEELGWGGFWMWDPVENAALIPWFTATAYLHSSMMQERRNMLRVWNVVLVFLTFILTIFGTFLTRSGMIKSVHSFSESLLGVDFLLYLGLLVVVSAALLIWRYRDLRTPHWIDHFFSREAFFVLNNWLLVAAALIVTWGTLFPKISDLSAVQSFYNGVVGTLNSWFGLSLERLTSAVDLGESWFNKILTPVGITLLLLTGVGPLISWHKATVSNVRRNFLYPAVVSAVVLFVGSYRMIADGIAAVRPTSKAAGFVGMDFWSRFGSWWSAGGKSEIYGVLCVAIGVFVILVNIYEFGRGIQLQRKRHGGRWYLNLWRLLQRSPRRYGGYLVHLGVVFLFFGFAGMAFRVQTEWLRLSIGDAQLLGNYRMTYVGVTSERDAEKSMLFGLFAVTGRDEGVSPERLKAITTTLAGLGFPKVELDNRERGPVLYLNLASAVERERFLQFARLQRVILPLIDRQKSEFDATARRLVFYSDMGPPSGTTAARKKAVLARAQHLSEALQKTAKSLTGKPLMIVPDVSPRWLRLTFTAADTATFETLRAVIAATDKLDQQFYRIVPQRAPSTGKTPHGVTRFVLLVKGVGRELRPASFHYEKHEMTTSEVAIWSRLHEDLYLVINGIDNNNQIVFKAFVNPMVAGLPLGTLLLILGALLALLPQGSRARVRALVARGKARKAEAT